MWTPSTDFTYGVGAGLAVWFAFECLRVLRECAANRRDPAVQTVTLPRPPNVLHPAMPLAQPPTFYAPTAPSETSDPGFESRSEVATKSKATYRPMYI